MMAETLMDNKKENITEKQQKISDCESIDGNGSGGLEKEVGKEKEGRGKAVTEKMVELMAVMAEHWYLTIREVEMVYTNQSHAYRVISTLQEQGLIRGFYTNRKPKNAYCLTFRGYRLLAHEDKLRVNTKFNPDLYKPFLFNHQGACTQVRLILEKHALVTHYEPESMLRERMLVGGKLCDGELCFKMPDKDHELFVGVEVELNLKNSAKLTESLERLGPGSGLDAVWWICGDQGLMQSLQQAVGYNEGNKPAHYFIVLNDLKAGNMVLRDVAGELYSFDPGNLAWPPVSRKDEDCELESPCIEEGADQVGEAHKNEEKREVEETSHPASPSKGAGEEKKNVPYEEKRIAETPHPNPLPQEEREAEEPLSQGERGMAVREKRKAIVFARFLADCWAYVTVIAICSWGLFYVEKRFHVVQQSVSCLKRIYYAERHRAAVRAFWIEAVMECANQKTEKMLVGGDSNE
ncbi:hypothetical protein ACFL6Y_10605 [Elusimicrobiota bacterium]